MLFLDSGLVFVSILLSFFIFGNFGIMQKRHHKTFERRKFSRLEPAQKKATVSLQSPLLFGLIKKNYKLLGNVLDISYGGASVVYSGSEVISTDSDFLSISLPEEKFFIDDIPYHTVWDYKIENDCKRVCGLKFSLTTKQHRNRIKKLINLLKKYNQKSDSMENRGFTFSQ